MENGFPVYRVAWIGRTTVHATIDSSILFYPTAQVAPLFLRKFPEIAVPANLLSGFKHINSVYICPIKK
jgi:hypothetical protein